MLACVLLLLLLVALFAFLWLHKISGYSIDILLSCPVLLYYGIAVNFLVRCGGRWHLRFIGFELPLTRTIQNSSNFSQTLERLSSKPGVIATLVLDRASNALLQSTGSFTFWSASTASKTAASAPNASATNSSATETSSIDSASSFASTVISYVKSTGELVQHMDSEVCSSSSEAECKLTWWKLG
jgi:dynein light chain roadblock-type